MRNMLKNPFKTYSPCRIIHKMSKHPVLSATSEGAFAHLLMRRKKEVAPVITGLASVHSRNTMHIRRLWFVVSSACHQRITLLNTLLYILSHLSHQRQLTQSHSLAAKQTQNRQYDVSGKKQQQRSFKCLFFAPRNDLLVTVILRLNIVFVVK